MVPPPHFDTVVVGSGFGGLGAALALAERGARVLLCERLNYPGGCASTFTRDGYRFEAGATLFSGFGKGQLFQRWIEKHGLDVTIDWLDPVVEFRAPGTVLPIGRSRGSLEAAMGTLEGAPKEALQRFFRHQRRVADTLWSVLDRPELLPPFSLRSLATHATRSGSYLPLLRDVGRPLVQVLERFGLAGWPQGRLLLDALCQITVQCGASEAEAPFALSVLDYFSRGTGHVRGGIGVLASAMVGAIERLGGEVRLSCRVESIRRHGPGFEVHTRRGTVQTETLVLNALPGDACRLLGQDLHHLARLQARAEEGWGAVMLYRVARAPSQADGEPHHLQLVADPSLPLQDGNHVFLSISGARDEGRAPEGLRTLTASTHVRPRALREGGARAVEQVQDRMRATLRDLAPEWEEVVHELPASPRTFERFTGRSGGLVGGIPRRAGLRNYFPLGPLELTRGAWLVGDTAFPGQSTLAVATGGTRVASKVLNRLARTSRS
jgi:phytoene dehydrogenase-like protein